MDDRQRQALARQRRQRREPISVCRSGDGNEAVLLAVYENGVKRKPRRGEKARASDVHYLVGGNTPGYAEIIQDEDAAPKKKPSQTQKARDHFDLQLRQHGLQGWIHEHRFFKGDEYAPRQWRFDFANLSLKVAVEIEGLVVRRIGGQMVSTGRHANVSGFREDCRKYASAAIDGWYVLRFEQSMIFNGEAIAFVERFIARRLYEAGRPLRRKMSSKA